MTWLLDTNVVSEISKPLPDPNCVDWLEQYSENSAISTITLAELRYGIERLPAGKKKAEKDRAFQFLLENYQGRFF